MSLDSIQQNARTILEMHKVYEQLLQQNTPQVKEKLRQTRKYLLTLSQSMQKMVEEEKQNAG